MSYYTTLNVAADATETQIREAYHALCLALHPDKQTTEQGGR